MPADGDTDILETCLNDLVDDADFHDLDERLGRFNLFEAMGGVRAELRHSNFLAFLFSPSRAHGLGALVLEKTVRAILASTPAALGPCDPTVRQRFYDLAQKRPVFKGITRPLGVQTSRFFNRELLTPNVARMLDFDQQLAAVGLGWSGFQSEDLMPLITEVEEIAAELG